MSCTNTLWPNDPSSADSHRTEHSLFSAFTGEVSVLPENHWEVDLHRQRSAGLYLDSVLHIQTGPTLLMFGRTVLIYLLCSQEVNFGMLDCSDGSVLNSLETLLAHIMLPALRSQQVRTAVFILSSSRTADHWHVDLNIVSQWETLKWFDSLRSLYKLDQLTASLIRF